MEIPTISGILRRSFGLRKVELRRSDESCQTSPPYYDKETVVRFVDENTSITYNNEDGNMNTPRLLNTPADKVRFSYDRGDVDDIEHEETDEDYSASVNAILHRRASTKRGKRRSSSPFSHEEISTYSSPRRRSSAFTTSSETAISIVDDAEIKEEEIYENIRLHKEVIANVKQQPWPIRRKLKLIEQAKLYVKRHEGELQVRLKQSRSTKDIFTRFHIVMIKKWQHTKREAINFMTLLIPWELRIKEIESHFGTVVASYFTFLRWLFWVNLVISIILTAFVIVPEVWLNKNRKDENRKELLPNERRMTIDMILNFEGRLKYSPLFYGYYSNRSDRSEYSIPTAYFMIGIGVYMYSFIATLRKMAVNFRLSKLSEKEDECIFTWKLFSGWDYMIGNAETSHNRTSSIVLGFKEALLEEAEKKKEKRSWQIITARVFVNLNVLWILIFSVRTVIYVVNKGSERTPPEVDDASVVIKWWHQNETTIVMTAISSVFPFIFELFGFIEKYHPRKTLRIQLGRIMILNLLTIYTLTFTLFNQIGDMTNDLEIIRYNITNTKFLDFIPAKDFLVSPNRSFTTTILNQKKEPVFVTDLDDENKTKSFPTLAISETFLFTPSPSVPVDTLDIDNFLKNIEPLKDPATGKYNKTLFQSTKPYSFIFETNFTDESSIITDESTIDGDVENINVTSAIFDTLPVNVETTTEQNEWWNWSIDENSTTIYELDVVNTTRHDFDDGYSIKNITDENYYIVNSTSVIFTTATTERDEKSTTNGTNAPRMVTQSSIELSSMTQTPEIRQISTKTPSSTIEIKRNEIILSVNSSGSTTTTATPSVRVESIKNVTEIRNATTSKNGSPRTNSSDISDSDSVTCKPTAQKTEEDTLADEDLAKKVKKLDISTKQKLRRLCWETIFGQELMKLTVMDFVSSILSTFFGDFIRALLVRYMNKIWCWDLEKKFPKYADFKIAENILHLVHNQGLVWMGMFFSPGLPLLNVVKLMLMMYLRSWAVLTCNVPHEVVFRASRSNNFYLALLLTMLFLCVLPVCYAIVRLQPSWHCGPFSSHRRIYLIFSKTLKNTIPSDFHFIMDYMASPGAVIPLIIVLLLIIYYLASLTSALREANIDLKVQLRRERTEERKKMFQMASRRKRGGSDMDSTFAKWKKILHEVPSNKLSDDSLIPDYFDDHKKDDKDVDNGFMKHDYDDDDDEIRKVRKAFKIKRKTETSSEKKWNNLLKMVPMKNKSTKENESKENRSIEDETLTTSVEPVPEIKISRVQTIDNLFKAKQSKPCKSTESDIEQTKSDVRKPSYIDKWKQKSNISKISIDSDVYDDCYNSNTVIEPENRKSTEHSIIIIPEIPKQYESISNRIKRRLRKVISMGSSGENKCIGDIEPKIGVLNKDDMRSIVENFNDNVEFEFVNEIKPSEIPVVITRPIIRRSSYTSKIAKSSSLNMIDCDSKSNGDFLTRRCSSAIDLTLCK